MSNNDNFIRQFLKHRKFTTKIADNIDEKVKRSTEEQEMLDRMKAEAMTKMIVNEMMPTFRKMMEKENETKDLAAKSQKPVRKIIIPD